MIDFGQFRKGKMNRGILSLFLLFFEFCSAQNAYETQIVPANLDVTYTDVVNSSVMFIFRYNDIVDSGLRVNTVSLDADDAQPVVVVVRQEKGVLSWQIPFFVKRDDSFNYYDRYYSVNRTLCPIENDPKILTSQQVPKVNQ